MDMLVTHLQGPHQSVCWLRPKRARHFLGEPGSERRHAEDEKRRRGERKEGQTDTHQTEERQSAEGGGPGGGEGGFSRSVWLVAARRSEKHGKHSQESERQPRVCVCASAARISFFLTPLRRRGDGKVRLPARRADVGPAQLNDTVSRLR